MPKQGVVAADVPHFFRNPPGDGERQITCPFVLSHKIASRIVREILELFFESHIYLALALLHLHSHRHLLLPQ